jgi:S1-C subfamily serine protease
MSQESVGWYVRSRGRTLGPFSWAQLESLRDRGQLARFHEVSQDKRSWAHASTLTDLFCIPSDSGQIGEYDVPQNASPSAQKAQGWFYQNMTGTSEPVNAEQIGALVRSGKILADTPMWREGFPCWLPLRDVRELASLLVPAAAGPTGSSAQVGNAGINVGSLAPRPVGIRGAPSRYLVIAAAAGLLVTLTASAIFVVNKYRSDGLRLVSVSQNTYIDSHMSKDIPRATGLVVSGASVTNLKSGELFEVPGSRGTCFALDSKGYLLTNRHVVEEYVKLTRADATIEEVQAKASCRIKPELWVYFAKDKYEAKVIYMSGKYDVAVLKVDRDGPCFRLNSNTNIIQGTHIYALGFPAASSEPLSVEGAIQRSTRKLSENVESVLDDSDYRYSITDGIVSMLRTELSIEYIQHSAPISGGNSGGPLIYDDGSVIGINTLVSFGKENAGVGVKYYAVSVNQALNEISRKVPDIFSK